MKTIKNLLSIFVIFTTLTFVSCENEPVDSSLLKNNTNNSGGGNTGGGNTGGGNTGGGNSTYYVKVKMDGVQKQWTGVNATGVFLTNNIFTIACLNGSNLELSLTVNNTLVGPVTTGNYPYEWALTTAIYENGSLNLASAYADFTVSTGGINITQINTSNKTIKGTFTFIGKNDDMTVSKNFTNGEFFLQYP